MPVSLPSSDSPSRLSDLLDREHVVARVTELFLATDRKDWPAVEACFASEVAFDMSSAGAGPPRSVRPSEIAGGWESGLAAVEHVHHQAGNFVVRLARRPRGRVLLRDRVSLPPPRRTEHAGIRRRVRVQAGARRHGRAAVAHHRDAVQPQVPRRQPGPGGPGAVSPPRAATLRGWTPNAPLGLPRGRRLAYCSMHL